MDAPAPMVTKGPIDASDPMIASGAMALRRSMPRVGGAPRANIRTAWAKSTYGWSLRRTAHGAGGSSPAGGPRMAGADVPAGARGEPRAFRAASRACTDAQVVGAAAWPRHHHVVFDDRAAGDARLRRQEHAPADRDAVGDVNQVVDFRARLDARLADRRAVDRGVGANLNVVFDDDGGVLRDFQMRAVGLTDE